MFENKNDRKAHTGYFLLKVELKDYNVMIDGRNFFDQPIRNDQIRYDNIWKIVNGQGENYTTGCLLDYLHFKEYYKLIAIDLSKQQTIDADPKDNILNVKLSISQLNKLKLWIKSGTEVTLNLSSNMVSDSSNETNFPHKLLLIDTQVSGICKAFANGWSANIKLEH